MKLGLSLLSACVAALLAAASAQAAVIRYQASLTPEVAGATGSGLVNVEYDTLARTLLIWADWTGLSGTTTVAHIHCCTAAPGFGTVGVAVTPGTLPGFAAGVSSGSYLSPLIDLTSEASFTTNFLIASGDLANAEAALIAGLDAGLAYFNVHTIAFPSGEIRGFPLKQAQAVPEPASWMLLASALALVLTAGRRRCRSPLRAPPTGTDDSVPPGAAARGAFSRAAAPTGTCRVGFQPFTEWPQASARRSCC